MNRKTKIRYGRIIVLLIITALLTVGLYKATSSFLSFFYRQSEEFYNLLLNKESRNSELYNNNDEKEQEYEVANVKNSESNKLNSPYAILLRLKDQKTLYETKSEETIYPASLTKIMTAIVAIENISDINEKIVMPEDIFPELYEENASMAGYLPGEEVSAIDALYGAMLPSGAECCIGLAYDIAGSEQEFVNLMNKKAADLGMTKSHFENSTGLQNDNHYTTVRDLSVLLDYALKNDTFRRIFTAEKYNAGSTNIHHDGIAFYSNMFKKMGTYEFEGGRFLGGKTGYNGSESGLCLASLAEKSGTEYILITAGAEGDSNLKPYHIMDAFTVYEKLLKN